MTSPSTKDQGHSARPFAPQARAVWVLIAVTAIAAAGASGWWLLDARPFATTATLTVEKAGSADRTYEIVRVVVERLQPDRDTSIPGSQGAAHIAVSADDRRTVIAEFEGTSAEAARALARVALPVGLRAVRAELGDGARVEVTQRPGTARRVGSPTVLATAAVAIGAVTALLAVMALSVLPRRAAL